MSLVNDALKRATEKHNRLPSAAPPPLQLRPVEPEKPSKAGMGLVLPATLLTIILAALFALRSHKKADPVPDTPPVAREPAAGSKPAAGLPGPLVVSAREVPVAAAPAPPSPVASPAPIAPLKLQGVFYNPSKPSAIISGKTVYVGDSLRGLRVVAIGSSSALLIGAGQTNLLRLE